MKEKRYKKKNYFKGKEMKKREKNRDRNERKKRLTTEIGLVTETNKVKNEWRTTMAGEMTKKTHTHTHTYTHTYTHGALTTSTVG